MQSSKKKGTRGPFVLLPMGCRKVTALLFQATRFRSESTQDIRNFYARGRSAAIERSGATTSAWGSARVQKDFSGLLGALFRGWWKCAYHMVSFGLLI
jgi:hypothetical protein